MKSSACLIHVILIAAFATNIWANTAPPTSSLEITDDESSYQFMVPGPKRSRFLTGSRYGRSQGGVSAEAQTVNVVPRNNRFFTGSRYGKRADESMAYVFQADAGAGAVGPSASSTFEIGSPLNCLYAAVKDFPRCVQRFRAAALMLQNDVATEDEPTRP